MGIINKMVDKIKEIVSAGIGLIFLFYLGQVIFRDLNVGPLLSPGLFLFMMFVLLVAFIAVIVGKIMDLF